MSFKNFRADLIFADLDFTLAVFDGVAFAAFWAGVAGSLRRGSIDVVGTELAFPVVRANGVLRHGHFANAPFVEIFAKTGGVFKCIFIPAGSTFGGEHKKTAAN